MYQRKNRYKCMKKNEEFSRKSTHFLKSACLALCLVSYGGSAIYAASTYAEQTTLTVRMNNRTVKDVFSYIEKNSEFIFGVPWFKHQSE